MKRRAFLALGAAGTGILAGCHSQPNTGANTTASRAPNTPDAGARATSTRKPNSPDTTSNWRVESAETIFVSQDGSDTNSGTREKPIKSIQKGFNQAQPGQTVHVLPGRYHEWVETVRPGEPDNPITLTGPPEAVFVGGDQTDLGEPLKILHSHIHIEGLTFDGLQDPDRPDDVGKDGSDGTAYAKGNISVNPFNFQLRKDKPNQTGDKFPGYIRDIKIKPHAVGNVLGAMINTFFAKQIEIGEFEIIGPGGLKHLKGDRQGHNGEVVYLGTPSDKFGGSGTSISGVSVDKSHDIHVHHILNKARHPHAELVDVKGGCYDVTIEYCTDRGGAASYVLPGHDSTSEGAVKLGGNDVTLRWCIIEGSHGQAVEVGAFPLAYPERFEESRGFPLPETVLETAGRDNSIYGNRLVDNAGLAVQYPMKNGQLAKDLGPKSQRVVCANVYNGKTHGEPGAPCPASVPTSDQIGHLGGDSPFT